jgi:hypothetical protein
MPTDEKSMASDFDLLRTDRPWRREDAELNFQMWSFLFGDWREAVVIERGCPCSLCHGAADRIPREYIADTSTQLSPQIERSERPSGLGEMGVRRIQGNLKIFQRGSYGIVR